MMERGESEDPRAASDEEEEIKPSGDSKREKIILVSP